MKGEKEMALKAGRRGLHKSLVDAFGFLKGEMPTGDYYTKTQTDNKFETKTHANNTFQKQTLEVPIEMLSGSKLTVEDALQGLNEEKFTYADNGVLGAKNLLNFTGSGISNDVEFTNDNGIVTANGTASGNATVNINITLPAGTYTLNGCPTPVNGDVAMQIYLAESPYTNYGYDTGGGVTFTLDEEKTLVINCIVYNGKTVTNKVFKPMLRLAIDTDNTYQPFAMTNRELTGAVRKTFYLKKVLTANDDLDKLITLDDVGIYGVQNDEPLHLPESAKWGVLEVINNGGAQMIQRYTRSTVMYIRASTGTTPGSTYSSWIKFTGAEV